MLTSLSNSKILRTSGFVPSACMARQNNAGKEDISREGGMPVSYSSYNFFDFFFLLPPLAAGAAASPLSFPRELERINFFFFKELGTTAVWLGSGLLYILSYPSSLPRSSVSSSMSSSS